MQPQNTRFSAKYELQPQPARNRALAAILNTRGKPDLLKQVNINRCIKLASKFGKEVIAWVQDVLVSGFNTDAELIAEIEIYLDLLAYGVGTDKSCNMPFMLFNRFEPE